MKLRIATWNIAGGRRMVSLKKFDYGHEEDAEYFAKQLQKLELDVICLQESHVSKEDSLARRMAGLLDMPYVAETPGCPSHIDTRYRLATAIISRMPYVSARTYLLPRPTFELRFEHSDKVVLPYDRYTQVVTFESFSVATMHTEPLPSFGLEYESGIGEQLAAEIDSFLASKLTPPMIIAADFNMDRPEKALPQLMQSQSLHEALPTGPTRPHGSNPDHILYSPEWKVLEADIVKTQSDHFLCWSELKKA